MSLHMEFDHCSKCVKLFHTVFSSVQVEIGVMIAFFICLYCLWESYPLLENTFKLCESN